MLVIVGPRVLLPCGLSRGGDLVWVFRAWRRLAAQWLAVILFLPAPEVRGHSWGWFYLSVPTLGSVWGCFLQSHRGTGYCWPFIGRAQICSRHLTTYRPPPHEFYLTPDDHSAEVEESTALPGHVAFI